jgi:14-3-3 protein epsilon
MTGPHRSGRSCEIFRAAARARRPSYVYVSLAVPVDFWLQHHKNTLDLLIRAAETAERYDDAYEFFVRHVDAVNGELDPDTRARLMAAIQRATESRVLAWRTVASSSPNQEVVAYAAHVAAEVQRTCQRAIATLALVAPPSSGADRVQQLGLSAQLHRYLAEIDPSGKHAGVSAAQFEEALHAAVATLVPTHPIRLEIVLNYAAGLYEVFENKKYATELTQRAIDEAIGKLDKLQEGDYEDTTRLLVLLRDNLQKWG